MKNHPKKGLGSVVIGNFKNRRRQNALVMAGVLMSVFFLSAALFGVSTMLASGDEYLARSHGRQNFMMWETGENGMSSLVEEGYLSEYAIEQALYTSIGEKDVPDDDFNIARFTPELDAVRRFIVTDGRLPEKEGEIAVEFAALMRLGQGAELGSTIALDLELYDGAYAMPDTVQRSFTLVGVLRSKNCYETGWTMDEMIPNWRLSEALVCADEPLVPGSRYMNSLVGVYCGPADENGWPLMQEWEDEHAALAPAHSGYFKWDYDWNYNPIASRLFADDTDSTVMMVCVVVVFFALTAASMIAISSMLTANIEKRSGQIGMLRAIGATRRQIRRLLLGETLLIALVTLPLGAGLAAGIILLFSRIYPDTVVFSMPLWMAFADIAACAVCVFLSSYMPLRRSMRITPMQAVRDIEKTRLFLQLGWKSERKFRPERLLAKRGNSLRRGRTRALQALVCFGCVFFCAMTWVATILTQTLTDNVTTYQYSLYNYNSTGGSYLNDYTSRGGYISAQDVRDIEEIPYVERVESRMSFAAVILMQNVPDYITAGGKETAFDYLSPEVGLTDRFLIETGLTARWTLMDPDNSPEAVSAQRAQELHEIYLKTKEQLGWEEDTQAICVQLIAMSDEYLDILEEYVYAGQIDREKLDSGQQVLVVAPQRYAYRLELNENTNYQSYFSDAVYGDRIRPEYGEVFENDVFFAGENVEFQVSTLMGPGDYDIVRETKQIGALISEEAIEDYQTHVNRFTIVTSMRGAQLLGISGAYNDLRVYTLPFPDEETRHAVSDEIEAISLRDSDTYYYDLVESAREQERFVRIYLIACGVLFALIYALSYGMLTGAVAGRIQSEVRQIGTMRAVGASKRAVFGGYAWQLFRMFLWGGGVGWALSLGFVWVVVWNERGSVPLQLIAAPAYLLPLAGLCLLTVWARLRPVFNRSVVENIRVL